jgi:hypothetical protein
MRCIARDGHLFDPGASAVGFEVCSTALHSVTAAVCRSACVADRWPGSAISQRQKLQEFHAVQARGSPGLRTGPGSVCRFPRGALVFRALHRGLKSL